MNKQKPRKIVVLEAHDDLYYYWRDNNMSDIALVHIDPHCDLHGALIHTGENYMVHTLNDHVHEGNFLTYAVKEGIVNSIKWVFDAYGNRLYDDTTVKFDTDFSSRLPGAKSKLQNAPQFPITYERIPFENWDGFTATEHLSLDWDFFAFQEKDEDNIEQDCKKFLDKEWQNIPDMTYICYSHDYVHASCVLFCKFIDKLSRQFDAEIEYYRPQKPEWPGSYSSVFTRIGGRVKTKTKLWLQRKGIH